MNCSYFEISYIDQFSRDLSRNVKRGLHKKANLGWRAGRAPIGYLNSKTRLKGEQEVLIDPERFEIVKQVFRLMLSGNYTVPQLLINELGLRSSGTRKYPSRKLHLSHLYRILTNPIYYGWFPWKNPDTGVVEMKKGGHLPLITEIEFDRIQFLLGRKGRPRPKTHKFAFTGLMKCSCGSSITCEEKIKRQKNGNVHRYVYYHCTRKVNPACTEKSVELNDLELQISSKLSELTISDKFKSWAVKYLHEIRKEEALSHHAALEAKQKRLASISEQISNLALLFTSPENTERSLLSAQEYQKVKTPLMKEQVELENAIKEQGEEVREWVKLTEKTFTFATYARVWSEKGTEEDKRAIFACLSSNLLLSNKKMALSLEKPFEYILERKNAVEVEIERFEPVNGVVNKGDVAVFEQQFPILCRVRIIYQTSLKAT